MSTAVLDRNSQATNTILPLPSTGNPDRSGTTRDVYMNAAPRATLARRAFFLVHGTDVQVSTAFTSYITTTVQESRGWWLGMDKLLLEARDALNSRLPVFGAQFALSHFSAPAEIVASDIVEPAAEVTFDIALETFLTYCGRGPQSGLNIIAGWHGYDVAGATVTVEPDVIAPAAQDDRHEAVRADTNVVWSGDALVRALGFIAKPTKQEDVPLSVDPDDYPLY